MSVLSRTDLSTPEKVYMAGACVASEGTYGALSDLSREFDISRPTLYRLSEQARGVLEEEFEPKLAEPGVFYVRVDRRQLERAIVGLRTVGPNSLPVIHELLPIIYPSLKMSYGTVWSVSSQAEDRAGLFNSRVPLGALAAAALDEMFSQGQPVLSGIDLDSGFVAILKAAEGRSAKDWAKALRTAKAQGFAPKKVVKDAALGIAAGVTEVFSQTEQRDDCFHALYELGKMHVRLERSAYAAIEQEERAEGEMEKLRKSGVDGRRGAQRLRRARERCQRAVELFDSFEKLSRQAAEALEAVDVRGRQLRSSHRMRQELLSCARSIKKLSGCRKLGQYLHNRIEGLVLYCEELHAALLELGAQWGSDTVRRAAVLWQAAELLYHGRQRWARHAQVAALFGAWAELRALLPAEDIGSFLAIVEHFYAQRHRASSAIEGLHSGLRPYLYVHKGVSQGFLALYQASRNLRPARTGRHKGTSAYERLTGVQVEDWLSVLGYPPYTSPN